MQVKTVLSTCAIAAVMAVMPPTVHAEDPSLAAARDLYGSAAYAEALDMLNGLLEGYHTPEEGQSIGLYRVLCLMALNRTAEADRAIEALIVKDPLYNPSTDDLSPRMRVSFTEARKRMLPSIIQKEYEDAKTAFDRADFATAATGFKRVLGELADPDIAAAASQRPLSDLRTLAGGFHQLSVKASAPPPEPAAVAPRVITPARDFRRLYTSEDADVVPPATVRQVVPIFPGKAVGGLTGVIEVLVDATGTVQSAAMLMSLQPQYDRLLLSAAKAWQYQPATVDGVPVKFLKRVQINVTPSSGR